MDEFIRPEEALGGQEDGSCLCVRDILREGTRIATWDLQTTDSSHTEELTTQKPYPNSRKARESNFDVENVHYDAGGLLLLSKSVTNCNSIWKHHKEKGLWPWERHCDNKPKAYFRGSHSTTVKGISYREKHGRGSLKEKKMGYCLGTRVRQNYYNMVREW